MTTAEPLLSLTELAQHLGRPRLWIWRLVKGRRIPFARIGRSYYFRRSEIEAWIAQHMVAPTAKVERRRARSLDDELAQFGLARDEYDAVN